MGRYVGTVLSYTAFGIIKFRVETDQEIKRHRKFIPDLYGGRLTSEIEVCPRDNKVGWDSNAKQKALDMAFPKSTQDRETL